MYHIPILYSPLSTDGIGVGKNVTPEDKLFKLEFDTNKLWYLIIK